MAQILFVERYPLPTFFQRRLSRIVPGLVVFVAAMLVANVGYVRLLHKPPLLGLVDAVAAVTFTMNYAVAYAHLSSVVVHTWSLAVEEHSYLLLAILALATRRNPVIASVILLSAACLCAINGLAQAHVYTGPSLAHDVYWRTDVRAGTVFLSAGLHLLLRQRTFPTYVSPALLVAGFVLGLQRPEIAYTLGSVAFALSVVTLQSAGAATLTAFSWKPLTQIGLWSFSIYLWQQPFYFAKSVVPSPVALAGALVAGVVSFYVIEQPARRYLNRLGSVKGDPTAARRSGVPAG